MHIDLQKIPLVAVGAALLFSFYLFVGLILYGKQRNIKISKNGHNQILLVSFVYLNDVRVEAAVCHLVPRMSDGAAVHKNLVCRPEVAPVIIRILVEDTEELKMAGNKVH